jgi:RNA polymerase sigma-70 factor (ECF subfamily)
MTPTPEPDTAELLARARRGDADATEQLLERHRHRLERMVAVRLDRQLAPRLDASDVVQETLIEASKKLADYLRDPPIEFYPWLRQIALEKVMKQHRRHRAHRRDVQREMPGGVALPDQSDLELADLLIDSATDPGRRVARNEWRDRVRAALRQLPETDRELLVLRYLEGLSMSETAAVLGVRVGAAKMRHRRALEALRPYLAGEGSMP